MTLSTGAGKYQPACTSGSGKVDGQEPNVSDRLTWESEGRAAQNTEVVSRSAVQSTGQNRLTEHRICFANHHTGCHTHSETQC